MEELWPGIVQAAKANYRKIHEIPDAQEVADADIFQQWLQARPGSPDHCTVVGQLERNVDGEDRLWS